MSHATTRLPEIFDTLEMAYAGYLGRFHGNTLGLYEYHLKNFLKWCMEHNLHPLNDVKRAHIEFYVRHLIEERHLKASTVNSAMTPVKGFYDIALWDEYIDRDPARKVALPKYHHTKVEGVSHRDLTIFLETAKASSPRHWALITLLSGMGLRISEALGLMIENYHGLDSGSPTITFKEKGGNIRTVPVPMPVLYALELARADRTEGPMIAARNGKPLSRAGGTGLVETVNRRAVKNGCKRHIHPHLLRKAAITAAFNMNMSVRDVQEFARHADPRTTSRHYDLGRTNDYRHPGHQIAAQMAV